MKKLLLLIVTWFIYTCLLSQSQERSIDKIKFFETDSALDATLTMDVSKFIRSKSKPEYLPATFTFKLADSNLSEQIRIIARGNMRRKICYMPPIKMNFHNTTSPTLYPLGSLKLVCACNQNDAYDQLLIKEYLVYKIYNLLTEKSFRVRLLNLNYEDAGGKKKTVLQHAFLVEDAKELAKRNGCKVLKDLKLRSESTNRNQMTMVAIFEYMIGNTDWGVSVNHNIILIQTKEDSTQMPYVVPYDFDYAGLVNADYAVPNENLDIENVGQRLYRGYQRTMPELNDAILIFNKQKDSIYFLVKNFDLLTSKNRQQVIDYLDDFYKMINDPRQVNAIFIDQARKM